MSCQEVVRTHEGASEGVAYRWLTGGKKGGGEGKGVGSSLAPAMLMRPMPPSSALAPIRAYTPTGGMSPKAWFPFISVMM